MTTLPERALIGVIHLSPLPGSPRWGGSMDAVVADAIRDAQAYVEGGADALVIENFGDVPFTSGTVPAETVAAMSHVGTLVRREGVRLPIGYNVLRNDPASALGLAAATGGAFIRVNVHSGAMVTDQGIIEGKAFYSVRLRQQLCPDVKIFADVHVKHAEPLAGGRITDAAQDVLHRGLADGLIVSGSATGDAVDIEDLRMARAACPEAPIYVGSGSNAHNAGRFLQFANGLIVGSSVKRDGLLANPVDPKRVDALRRAMDSGAS